MFFRNTLHYSAVLLQQFDRVKLNFAFASMAAMIWIVCWWRGSSIAVAFFFLLSITFVFVIRIDIAFYMVLALFITRIAMPLSIPSPFDPTENADLPLYEVFAPLLGLCLMVRIAIGKEKLARSPLNVPILVWFGFTVFTYMRNPVFLRDLLSASGTGAIYHLVYPVFLGGIFYLFGASILNTKKRITLAVKMHYAIMAVGMLLIMSRFAMVLLADRDISWLSLGWYFEFYPEGGKTVFRSVALSSFGASLLLATLYFGSHLQKWLQITICLLLPVTLALGGTRSALIPLLLHLPLAFIMLPRARWLIGCLLFVVILFGLILLPIVEIPYTMRRITGFSTESGPGSSSLASRLHMAQVAWDVAKNRPLTGIGYGRLPEYYPEALRSKRSGMAGGGVHNGFLSLLMTHGVIGLVIFLWLLLKSITISWRVYKNLEEGFLRHYMLLITLARSISVFMFFISSHLQHSVYNYYSMGIISSMYAISLGEGVTINPQSVGADATGEPEKTAGEHE